LLLLAADPPAFWFGNVGFHAIRSDEGFIGDLGDKWETVTDLVSPGGEGNGVQMSLLLVFSLLLAGRSTIPAARRACQVAFLLGLICLLPTPTYVQYWSVTVPFLIVAAVAGGAGLLDSMQPGRRRRAALAAGGLLSVLFLIAPVRDYRRFVGSGEEVSGIDQGRAFNWKISTVSAVSRAIDGLAAPGERVMSLWPGYIFQSKAEAFPGLENNSATFLADGLRPDQLERYHILSPAQIQAAIASHIPKLVVVGNQESMLVDPEPFENALVSGGYKVVSKIGDTRLWAMSASPGSFKAQRVTMER
jgi:hypothetical protein